MSPERTRYNLDDIVDTSGPRFAVRNYLEQRDLRNILAECSKIRHMEAACEIGCGYGRMTMVLLEFFDKVDGYEREDEFVAIARNLIPDINFINVASLDSLGAADRSYDLVLSFTVLQHIIDPEVKKIAGELKRILKPGGYIVLCEETDTGHRYGDTESSAGFCTIGRSVEQYSDILRPLELVGTAPRKIESGYPRKDVGTFMVFHNKAPVAEL